MCSGTTGHNEVVRLRYDTAQIGLREILEIFFTIHDPTSRNRQGNDVGTQYRSGIYFETAVQQTLAQDMLHQLNTEQTFGAPVCTELLALANYSPAEDYHQNYFAQHPGQGYCAAVVGPKVAKFRSTFAQHQKRD